MLITVPRLDLPGGVANYFRVLGPYLDRNEFFEVGSTSGNKLIRVLVDYWRFHRRLRRQDVSLVHLNPSMGIKAAPRDAVFLLIARMHSVPVLAFFHGWNTHLLPRFGGLFRAIFNKAEAIVVLASEYKAQLISLGIMVPIHLSTTCVDDSIFGGIANSSGSLRVLFLSRLVRGKGLREAILACSRLEGAALTIAGDGPERASAEALVAQASLSNVTFLGHVEGDEKRRAFLDANVYVFPSLLDEGMPTSVLEAMAYGLPVVTRRVGGLKDFFEDNRMGFLAETSEPEELAGLLKRLTPVRRAAIGSYNKQYARDHFAASRVAARTNAIYRKILMDEPKQAGIL